MQLIGILTYILKFFQAILAGNTRLQKLEDGELSKCKRARNKAARQRGRSKIPSCSTNQLNTEALKSGAVRETSSQLSNIQKTSKPNYEPWNKYHQLNQIQKLDQTRNSEHQKSQQHWICIPQQPDYFLSKPQENNQHLSAKNLLILEPLSSPSKLQEAQECSAEMNQKPASSPSNLQESNLQLTDEGPLSKLQGGFISLFYYLLQDLWDPSPRVPQRHQGSSAQDKLKLGSEGTSQTTDPSPAILLESSCKPLWNISTMDNYP